MTTQAVDFRKTTAAVLKDFSPEFTDLIVDVLELRQTGMNSPDDNNADTFSDIQTGYGILILADSSDDRLPFTMTTEFLVPSNELAASFMVMWRRWCEKREIKSRDGLLSLIHRVTTRKSGLFTEGMQNTGSNITIGLMGAIIDNYPEIIASMQWSVDNALVPCLVIANDNNQARCGVCYGGPYLT